MRAHSLMAVAIASASLMLLVANASAQERRWLAGDHHVHSEWSVGWDNSTTPPTPVRGGDSPYSRTHNAAAAREHGLAWMVHTDHGGPNHSQVTREHAWPALLAARKAVPEVIQFHGMEFDVPAGEHASLIIAPGPGEEAQQFAIERDFSRREVIDTRTRDSEEDMVAALRYMQGLVPQPLLFINHPSRTATAPGVWGEVTPAELRLWQDAAPQVLVGMEGAPGHQADRKTRGLYRNASAPSYGGFDQMTAKVGGEWDALLAEGRRFWITANSDAHGHHGIGGADFYPGEYSKTYVWAKDSAEDVMDGLRHGRIFVVTGDLISGLSLQLTAGSRSASSGETLQVAPGAMVDVAVELQLPSGRNGNGDRPELQHVDVITGQAGDGKPDMQVRTLTAAQWQREGDRIRFTVQVPAPAKQGFVRLRGSSTGERDPAADVPGEDPWQDLWFYSNPVFIEVKR